MKPSLFIGCSAERLDIAYALQQNLVHDADVTPWTQGVFLPSCYPVVAISRVIADADFAVFVFVPDDIVRMREKEQGAVRDNVIFEVGFSMAMLGPERTFLLQTNDATNLRIPSDLLGVTPVTFSMERKDGNLAAALGSAANQIRRVMRQLGIRERPGGPADGTPQLEGGHAPTPNERRNESEASAGPELQGASNAYMEALIESAVVRAVEAAFIGRAVRQSLVDQEEEKPVDVAASEYPFDTVLASAFNTDVDKRLALQDSLSVLLQELYEMQFHEGWGTDVFRAVLAEIIRGMSETVRTLSNLCAEQGESSEYHGITPYSPAKRTDLILSSLIASLPAVSRYTVISDLGTWKGGKLDTFFNKSLAAIADRRVFIRRLFVVSAEEFEGSVTPQEAFEILKKHVSISKLYRNKDYGYRVRLLDGSKIVDLARITRHGVETKHYGILTVPDHPLSIKVIVDESDFSQLYFANITLNSLDFRRFDDAWEGAGVDLDLRQLDEARKRWNES